MSDVAITDSSRSSISSRSTAIPALVSPHHRPYSNCNVRNCILANERIKLIHRVQQAFPKTGVAKYATLLQALDRDLQNAYRIVDECTRRRVARNAAALLREMGSPNNQGP